MGRFVWSCDHRLGWAREAVGGTANIAMDNRHKEPGAAVCWVQCACKEKYGAEDNDWFPGEYQELRFSGFQQEHAYIHKQPAVCICRIRAEKRVMETEYI